MISESDKTDNEYEIAFDYGVTKVFLHKIANHPDKKRQWFADESWSPEQAVCLFYDIDPYEYEKIKNHRCIRALFDKAEKYQSQSPQEWKEFAIKNQIPIPTAFNRIPIVESASNESDKNPKPKQDTRQSQLHELIWRAYECNKQLNAQALWNEIKNNHEKYDTDKIIQEVTPSKILWSSSYGNESKLLRRSFDGLLSRLKTKNCS